MNRKLILPMLALVLATMACPGPGHPDPAARADRRTPTNTPMPPTPAPRLSTDGCPPDTGHAAQWHILFAEL